MLAILKELDSFDRKVPSFTLNGLSRVRTWTGVLVTVAIAAISILYGIIKFEHLVLRRNPAVLQNSNPIEAGVSFDLQ